GRAAMCPKVWRDQRIERRARLFGGLALVRYEIVQRRVLRLLAGWPVLPFFTHFRTPRYRLCVGKGVERPLPVYTQWYFPGCARRQYLIVLHAPGSRSWRVGQPALSRACVSSQVRTPLVASTASTLHAPTAHAIWIASRGSRPCSSAA